MPSKLFIATVLVVALICIGGEAEGDLCPNINGQTSDDCNEESCLNSNCIKGKICCPKPCGGTRKSWEDPCKEACGTNAECTFRNGAASCSCFRGHYGDPVIGCRPECLENADCPTNKACFQLKCQDPCPGTCGINAICKVVKHTPICTCPDPDRFYGDPFEHCKEVQDPSPIVQFPPPQANKKVLNPEIYYFRVESNIRYRYSQTQVISRVVNKDTSSREIAFKVFLPETAFISKFIMEIDGVPYEAYVKEKEEAKRVYAQAQSQGQSAGLVAINPRNSNSFDVSVNVKAQSKITFNLTYEELLPRRLGKYEQAIHVYPEQVSTVKDYQIVVNIHESQNISLLRTENSIVSEDFSQSGASNSANAEESSAIIERLSSNRAKISWNGFNSEKLSARKFVVQYDVERPDNAGEVLVRNGYFVHFFAPAGLKPLPKHVVFVLDTSGSMHGRRLEQLQEAMKSILAELKEDDFFNIVQFASSVAIWSPNVEKLDVSSYSNSDSPDTLNTPEPIPASKSNIQKAQNYIASLTADGGTNIYRALVQGLTSTFASQRESNHSTFDIPRDVDSILIFLTDGEPNVEINNRAEITQRISSQNKRLAVPIYSIALGNGADFKFLKQISLLNGGFARKIYEASDTSIQLQNFYAEISSPLLSNVTFNYTSDPSSEYSLQNITLSKFTIVFDGNEIAIAGRISSRNPGNVDGIGFENKYFHVHVEGITRDGPIQLNTNKVPLSSPQNDKDLFLEKLWAHLTIKQLLDAHELEASKPNEIDAVSHNQIKQLGENPKQRALRLALQYGFVTPLTSLVVVKPNHTDQFLSEAGTTVSSGNRVIQPISASHGSISPPRIGSPTISLDKSSPMSPCHPSPCGHNSICRDHGGNANCICLAGFAGDPFVGCMKQTMAPIPLNPCVPSPCGPNSICEYNSTVATCKCSPGSEGRPPNCAAPVPCSLSSDCALNLTCIRGKCADPCPGVCGPNALCETKLHIPTCICPEGYEGDPFVGCYSKEQSNIPDDGCHPSPCGKNAICYLSQGFGSCSCLANFTGNPNVGCHLVESHDQIVRTRHDLKDLSWWSNGTDRILITQGNSTESQYASLIATPEPTVKDCTIRNATHGHCVPLRVCIVKEILNDFSVYQDSYFCSLVSNDSKKELVAGICCQNKNDEPKSSIVQPN